MKLCVSPKDMMSLSKKGDLSWEAYCLDTGKGSADSEDQHYTPTTQPDIGELIEYLNYKGIEWVLTSTDKEPIDILWKLVKEDLES